MPLTSKNDLGHRNPKYYSCTILHEKDESQEPFTFTINDNFSVCLYPSTRPHCLETATLHKGLILMHDGKELVEEGMGFGVPVAIYKDEPYFSSNAQCVVSNGKNGKTFVKSFVMDTVSRKRISEAAYFNGGLYSVFHRAFHAVYVLNLPLTPILNKFIQSASFFNVNTEFVRVKPRGIVKVKYTCFSDSVAVEASFDQLEKIGCKEIVLLNEQGAKHFRRYSDAEGQCLVDDEIGPWMPVNANEAALSNLEGTLGFSLKKAQNAVLFRGREKIRDRYSWVGLSYSLPPATMFFNYAIRLK